MKSADVNCIIIFEVSSSDLNFNAAHLPFTFDEEALDEMRRKQRAKFMQTKAFLEKMIQLERQVNFCIEYYNLRHQGAFSAGNFLCGLSLPAVKNPDGLLAKLNSVFAEPRFIDSIPALCEINRIGNFSFSF